MVQPVIFPDRDILVFVGSVGATTWHRLSGGKIFAPGGRTFLFVAGIVGMLRMARSVLSELAGL